MTDETSSEQPKLPALSDAELREQLDRMADLTIDMSEQVTEQTRAINHISTVASEARRAAKAAQKQTNPEHYGELVGSTIDGKINDNLVRMGQMCVDLFGAANRVQDVLKKAEEDKSAALRDLWEREQKIKQFKARLPWFGLGAVVLVIVLTLLLPRFIASHPSGCAVLGSVWQTTTTGVNACVSYHP